MGAIEKGQEMLNIPMSKLPEEAYKYFQYLSNKVGMCIETCLTAYTAYAQYILDLKCDDDLYKLTGDEQNIPSSISSV